MIAARSLNVTHHVDRIIRDVRSKLKVTRKLTEDIDDTIPVIGHKVDVIDAVAVAMTITQKQAKAVRDLFCLTLST
jgi:hypothetical protein